MLQARLGGFIVIGSIMIGSGTTKDDLVHSVHIAGYDFSDEILAVDVAYRAQPCPDRIGGCTSAGAARIGPPTAARPVPRATPTHRHEPGHRPHRLGILSAPSDSQSRTKPHVRPLELLKLLGALENS
jgi:hypothetical protein